MVKNSRGVILSGAANDAEQPRGNIRAVPRNHCFNTLLRAVALSGAAYNAENPRVSQEVPPGNIISSGASTNIFYVTSERVQDRDPLGKTATRALHPWVSIASQN